MENVFYPLQARQTVCRNELRINLKAEKRNQEREANQLGEELAKMNVYETRSTSFLLDFKPMLSMRIEHDEQIFRLDKMRSRYLNMLGKLIKQADIKARKISSRLQKSNKKNQIVEYCKKLDSELRTIPKFHAKRIFRFCKAQNQNIGSYLK